MNYGTTNTVDRDDRWEQVKQIFQAALEKPTQKRKEYVEAACGGDPALRQEVERLLIYDRLGRSLMQEPAARDGGSG